MPTTYLMQRATLTDVDRETFWPLTLITISPLCKPASSALDDRSTRPTFTGHASTTVNPKPPYGDLLTCNSSRCIPLMSEFTVGIVESPVSRRSRLCITGTAGRSFTVTLRCFLMPMSSVRRWYQPLIGRSPVWRWRTPNDIQPYKSVALKI